MRIFRFKKNVMISIINLLKQSMKFNRRAVWRIYY